MGPDRQMKRSALILIFLASYLVVGKSYAQSIDEGQTGAWYMYFFDWEASESQWGVQGDLQYRSWNLANDFAQAIARAAVTYRPKGTKVKVVAGYAHFTSGVPGDSSLRIDENRTYVDINVPQKVGSRVKLRHRFRFEQRWIENLDFRTRWRYALFADIPFNDTAVGKGVWYASLIGELFINGEKDIGQGLEVKRYDRTWLYGALGYGITDKLRFQAGYLHENTNNYDKGYLQFGFSQKF